MLNLSFSLLLLLLSFSQNRKMFVTGQASLCSPGFVPGTCACRLADGSGIIDLSLAVLPLNQSSDPYSYLLTFCKKLETPSFDNCNNRAAVCEFNSRFNFNIGEPETTRFEYRLDEFGHRGQAVVMDTTFGGKRRTLAFMVCNPNLETTEFVSKGNFNKSQDHDEFFLYYMRLTGSVFCPLQQVGQVPEVVKVLSFGSTMLIVFFIFLVIYFIGGYLVLTIIFKNEGLSRIPNYSFWIELPGYAKDGTLYTWNSLKNIYQKYHSQGNYQY